MGPTGADSPSQNGAVEVHNGHIAVKVQMLLYMLGLPSKFWLELKCAVHERLEKEVEDL